jgi:hypothetical protein
MWAQRTAVLGASLAAEFPFTDNPIAAAGFVTGRLTALAVMGRYAWLLAWPAKLSCDYSYAQIPLARGTAVDVAAWLTVAGVGVAAVVGSRRNRARLFVAALALVAFLPASNLLFAAGTIMAQSHRRMAAGVATLAIVILLGARTWTRNRDWRDDLTLWRATVADAPASAKAHRALAEAMYDADPSHANIEAVLTEAERSVALLDGLPDSLNSAAAYRQAAGYQLDRAHLLERRPAASGAADAARAYGRAVALIEHALSIIRAQSAAIPGASREPEADANRLLAAARLGLQQPREALDAAARARALGPLNPLAYRLSASAQLLAGHPDAAVVDLMVGSIVSGDSGLNDAIIGVYQAGLDEERCAAISQGGRLALNLGCAIVRRHTCEAIAAAIPVERQLGRNDAADRLTSTARTTMSCQP